MPAKLQFWFEFASSYSYLSAMRIQQAASDQGVEVDWQPFLLGCLLCGLFFGSMGYFVINILWRWRVHRHWQARKKRREMAKKLTNGLD